MEKRLQAVYNLLIVNVPYVGKVGTYDSDVRVSLKVLKSTASGSKVCFVGVHWMPQQEKLMTGLNTQPFEDSLLIGELVASQC